MIRYENRCVECAEDMGCVGSVCRYVNVMTVECDECGEEREEIYSYGGQELCPDCLIAALKEEGVVEKVGCGA
jgi:hypothetical protein